MNDSTRKQLDATSPSATRPVDKLRLTEAPAAAASGVGPDTTSGSTCICYPCFADDE